MEAMKTFLTTIVFAGVIALASVVPARAQAAASSDVRWSAWVGCWAPIDAVTALTGMSSARTVCVVPAAGASAVDIVQIANGQILSREHVDATGAERKSDRDGCAGWERAQ